MDRGGVGRDSEGSNQAHLFQGGVAARCLIQELVILKVLRETLQHRQRLVEVYLRGKEGRRHSHTSGFTVYEPVSKMEGHGSDTHRHGNFGQLLADAVLHDAPQIEGIVGFVWDVSPPLSAGLQLLPRHVITAGRHLRVGQ